MADLAEREGARTEFVPSLGQPLRPHRDVAALVKVAAIARRFRPDIVHTHTAKAGFVGRTAALAAVRPRPLLVHTFHGHVLEGYFGAAKSGLYRRLERTLARRTDRLIGVSDSTVADLVRLGVAPPDRFDVIPLGLDLDAFARLEEAAGCDLRAELGIGEEEVVLGFVGRLVEIKRVDLLLRAFARARDGVRLRLLVVGDGELRPRLEALTAELGIADTVSFLGYRRDLPAIAAATDVAVLASANEGTPVSLIEAAAAGRPAVATRVGGVGDVVTPQTGILVDSGDVDALAVAIAKLARERGRRKRMGAAARERALSGYSADRLVNDIEELYDRLLEGR
jgi:glycosyltransferase involved in cell wall biosynthesis